MLSDFDPAAVRGFSLKGMVMAKAPPYPQEKNPYSGKGEKESTNKQYETEKAVMDAEKSMAIKQFRGEGAAKGKKYI